MGAGSADRQRRRAGRRGDRRSCGSCRRRVVRPRRSGRMRWTCCAGSGSGGRSTSAWDQATRVEARDFCRWLALRDKPTRAGVRRRQAARRAERGDRASRARGRSTRRRRGRTRRRCCGCSTTSTATPGPGRWSTRSRWSRERRGWSGARASQPDGAVPQRAGGAVSAAGARSGSRARIPDELFNRVFAELGSHRDRALVALWVSTGARAAELLGVRCGDVDPGQQLITVVRKGTRAVQQLPASPDAFVWLRLYQARTATRRCRPGVTIRCGGPGGARCGR